MKIKMIKFNTVIALGLLLVTSCNKNDLNVTNLNNPSYAVLSNESGITSFATGLYVTGFGDQLEISSIDDGLGIGMLKIVQGFHESMGDNIYCPYGNSDFKYADNPLSVKLDDGTVVNNPIGKGQIIEMRARNSRAFGATNSFLMEWTYMYFLNNATNVLLSKIDGVSFSGDAATKKAVLKAWGYWWKGYAYSRIGSMYYAGLKTDVPGATNGLYLSHDDMITEANANFDKAATLLAGLKSGGDYDNLLMQIIPTYMQSTPDGTAGIPSPSAWIKNINSMKARNLLANTRLSAMTSANWAQLKTYTDAGISNPSDYVFLIKNNADNSKTITFNAAGDGSVQGYCVPAGGTFFTSERLIQDYDTVNDKRFKNNFSLLSSPIVNKRGRGITFGTRYTLNDASTTAGFDNSVLGYYHSVPGVDNLFIGVSYEENMLMKAEVLINTNQIDAGIALINAVRTLQGAGVSSPNGLTLAQAKEQLRRERRCALVFRGVAFYDLRRMGMADDVTKGGGRTGCQVLDAKGVVNTNATINYSYLSYWDVPQNELDFNAPATGSAPTAQPN